MALITSDTTRSNILAFLITLSCIVITLLRGISIYDPEWNSNVNNNNNHLSSESTTATRISAVDNFESDKNAIRELERVERATNMSYLRKAKSLLKLYPVFDGNNHFPWKLRIFLDGHKNNSLDTFNFSRDLTFMEFWGNKTHTDLPRLRKGHVGVIFWVAYAPCQSENAVVKTLEQIDVIRRLVDGYPEDLQLCTTVQCVMETIRNGGKIASLIGVEGGNSIQSSVGVLHQMYKLGVRYLTLAHSCDSLLKSSSDEGDMGRGMMGREDFPRRELELIREMNRMGMIIDLSHASEVTMRAALKMSKTPVIFSHSGAKAICNMSSNLGDDDLKLLKKNGGVMMISFNTNSVYCGRHQRIVNIIDVVHHLRHIRDLIGVEHIAMGGGYDGGNNNVPRGLEDVSKYPHLFATLIKQGWKVNELKKIAITNILRVMEAVELVKQQLSKAISSSI